MPEIRRHIQKNNPLRLCSYNRISVLRSVRDSGIIHQPCPKWAHFKEETIMAFFNSAVSVLQTLVVALGAGLGIWGAINLLEGYGNDNPGANAHVR